MKYFVYLLSTLFFTSALAACSQQTTEVNESEAEGAAVIEKRKKSMICTLPPGLIRENRDQNLGEL